jgi:5-(carboxyamino)imidazole ribonucleotide synthase
MLDLLVAPGNVSEPWVARATELAVEAVRSLEAVGIVAVEMFLDTTGELWVNEVAPRPHNSGHHTIEANVTSQFEQHLRAIASLPLGDVRQTTPAAMANLVGQAPRPGRARVEGLREAARVPGVAIHVYGKTETRPGRKMGHVTAVAPDVGDALDNVRRARDVLRITIEE